MKKEQSLYEALLSGGSFSRAPALMCKNKKYTYKQLIECIDSLSLSLKQLKVSSRDVVTICLPPSLEFIAAVYAVNKLDAISYPVSIHKKDNIKKIAESVASRLIIGEGGEDVKALIKQNSGRFTAASKYNPNQTAMFFDSGDKVARLSSFAINSLVINSFSILGTKSVKGKYFLSLLDYTTAPGFIAGIHALLSCGGADCITTNFSYALKKIQHGYANFLLGDKNDFKKIIETVRNPKTLSRVCCAFMYNCCDEKIIESFNTLSKGTSEALLLPCLGVGAEAAFIAVSKKDTFKEGCFGKAISGAGTAVIENGAIKKTAGNIYVCGDGIFSGYIDSLPDSKFTNINGTDWLNTGLYGSIDSDGFIKIENI